MSLWKWLNEGHGSRKITYLELFVYIVTISIGVYLFIFQKIQ